MKREREREREREKRDKIYCLNEKKKTLFLVFLISKNFTFHTRALISHAHTHTH